MTRYVFYNHPAVPPIGIYINIPYELEELNKRFTMEEIKCLFRPEGFEWKDFVVVKKVAKD